MLYPATALQNLLIGGPDNSKVAVKFTAQHSSPLAAIRFYVINAKPPVRTGYADGFGGTYRFELCQDFVCMGGILQAGTERSIGKIIEDAEYAEWVNGGAFPLVGFSDMPILVAGQAYYFIITNTHSEPTKNYVSADFLISKTGTNPDSIHTVMLQPSGKPWTVRPEVIASPFGIFYADGNMQGNGGYQIAPDGSTMCGKQYGFGGLC